METTTTRSLGRPPVPAFVLLCFARLMVMLDLTIVVLALPSVQKSFGASSADVSWIVTIYALSFGGFLLVSGKAADLFGKRRILSLGYLIFSVASLLGGLSQNSFEFVIARGFQGLGAALMSPSSFALAIALFQDATQRNRAIAVWSAISGVAVPLGGLLGGLLVAGPGWRYVMLVNVPIGLLSLVLTPVLLPKAPPSPEARRLDVVGSFLVTAGLILLVYVIGQGNKIGWFSFESLSLSLGAAVLLGLFVAVERKVAEPVLRLGIFKDRSLAGANLTLAFGMAGFVSALFALSFYLQQVLGLGSVTSGLLFLPTSVAFIVTANFSPRLAARFGVQFPVLAGCGAMAAGFVLMSQMGAADQFLAPFLVGSVLMGCFGLAIPIFFMVGVAGVPRAEQGLASGLLSTSQQVGAGLGLSVSTAFAHGSRNSFLVCAGFLIFSAVATLTMIRSAPKPRTESA